MKIREKNIRNVEVEKGDNIDVLELLYTHKGESGKVLIRDYVDTEKGYKSICKQLNKHVKENYNKFKLEAES